MVRFLAAHIDKNREAVDHVVGSIAMFERPDEVNNVLQGMLAGLRGWMQADEPQHWHAAVRRDLTLEPTETESNKLRS